MVVLYVSDWNLFVISDCAYNVSFTGYEGTLYIGVSGI